MVELHDNAARIHAWHATLARHAQARHDAVQRNYEALWPAIKRAAREHWRGDQERAARG